MNQSPVEMFKKVGVSEKKILFRSLTDRGVSLFIKGEEDFIFELFPSQVTADQTMVLIYPEGETRRLSGQSTVIINFKVDEDRYFFHSSAEVTSQEVRIDLNNDLFILQRRKSPRLAFPGAYPQMARIIQHHRDTIFVEGRMIDFSVGGVRVEFPVVKPLFRVDDSIRIVLHLNHRAPLELSAQVRHSPGPGDSNLQVFGVQFTNISPTLESKLFTLFMDLQREIFLKFNG